VHAIERTIHTDASPEQVWDFLSDFTTTEQWDPPTRSTRRVEGLGGVGTRYHNVSHVMGRDIDIDYTVVEAVPPHRLQLHGSSSSMTMVDTISLAPRSADDGAGTRGTVVTYRAEFRPEGMARIAAPVLPRVLERIGDDAAERMAQCLRAL
jgi:uncharacterized protein YndB with AHSA1/START domain